MISRILSFTKKEFVSGLRNNMIIYILVFPIILALVMRFFIPSVEGARLTVAVDEGLGSVFIQELENYARVEVFENEEEVQKRVKQLDDVAGITKNQYRYVVLLEGNEIEGMSALVNSVVNAILSEEEAGVYKFESLGKNGSDLLEMSGSLLLLMSVILGGCMIGFNLIEEKEKKVIKALAVTPLRIFELVISHTLLALIISVTMGILSSLILMGTAIDYRMIGIALAATTFIGVVFGYFIGAYADNLISAIATLKVGMLFLMGIPIGSAYVAENIQWVFYPFPHYWAFQSYQNIFVANTQGFGFVASTVAALVSGMIILIVLIPILRKRLGLR